jgi:hypothetical protein
MTVDLVSKKLVSEKIRRVVITYQDFLTHTVLEIGEPGAWPTGSYQTIIHDQALHKQATDFVE